MIGVFAEAGFDGLRLCAVIIRCRGAMGIDVVYLVGTQIGFLQRTAHGSPF